MDIIVSESGGKFDEIMHLERDDFIGIILRMHQANNVQMFFQNKLLHIA